ncbi:MAG: hypothetical protein Q4F79_00115 [Eubacteriales bacterium]|nr:hypothetical protein [Eubacteriales bacterium]
MEKYLTIITTVLVATQVIRITQNTISLRRQNRLIKAQLDELGELTDKDIQRKIMIDKMLVEILPRALEKLEEKDDE